MIEAVPEVLPTGKGPHDFAFDVESMQKIRDHGTLDLWLEMCRQRDYPMVATGGYLCIASREPAHRFEAALLMIAHRHEEASFYFYYPAMAYLAEEVESTPENFKTLTEFVCLPEVDADGRCFAAALLPEGFLSGWVEAEAIETTPPGIQAMAVDSALVASLDNVTAASPKLK